MSLNLETEITDLFRRKLAEFIEWHKSTWKLDGEDEAEFSPEFVLGYNRAVEGVECAFEAWLEDQAL